MSGRWPIAGLRVLFSPVVVVFFGIHVFINACGLAAQ
jgi:hypothetical protein